MILALVWLTISTPFVFASQQELVKQGKIANTQSADTSNEEETAKPPVNNTEEKVPNSGNSLSEEYLHDHHIAHYFIPQVLLHHKCENADTYIAFHGELLVPPPNFV